MPKTGGLQRDVVEAAQLSLAVYSRIQHALYGAVGQDEAWPEALRVMAELFDASFSMLVAAGQGQRDQSFYAAWNHSDEAARAYSDYWWQHDIWLQQGVADGLFVQGNIARGSDIVPLPVFRQSRFYKEYLAPLSTEYLLVSAVSDGSVPGLAPPSHLSFFRRPDQPNFSEDDIAIMQLIFPHVVRAFDLHWSTRRLQEQVTLLHRFLDALDFGVVMLDPAGRVLYANQGVRTLMADPHSARWLGSLPQRVALHEPLGPLVHACARGQGGGAAFGQTNPKLMALTLPIEEPCGPAPEKIQPGACMLLLARHVETPPAVSDFVMRIFGLSPAEARLLPLMLRGCAPAEMALELGVKISTVRSQLSSIFAKTGSTRQQDLIRLLGSLPPVR
ncbi:DNA-binding CsgD family transcriptional regulator/PAS domain-containing protein [Ottowia thiooxydans]|uniref:DNA-binding CsgD family transcriptional regulator/PAS domain-containing protein n=1 Tax=Ottowia thiooxydans TaxID=219182 RepID=A0ABV2QHB0_9BURK